MDLHEIFRMGRTVELYWVGLPQIQHVGNVIVVGQPVSSGLIQMTPVNSGNSSILVVTSLAPCGSKIVSFFCRITKVLVICTLVCPMEKIYSTIQTTKNSMPDTPLPTVIESFIMWGQTYTFMIPITIRISLLQLIFERHESRETENSLIQQDILRIMI